MKVDTPYQLYSTDGCHLCDMAYEMVMILGRTDDVSVVDIVEDDALVESYGMTIPVIRHMNSGQEIGWPFEVEQLSEFFAKC